MKSASSSLAYHRRKIARRNVERDFVVRNVAVPTRRSAWPRKQSASPSDIIGTGFESKRHANQAYPEQIAIEPIRRDAAGRTVHQLIERQRLQSASAKIAKIFEL